MPQEEATRLQDGYTLEEEQQTLLLIWMWDRRGGSKA